jgi:FUS-interacting serine-arginine-rich protein 1
MSSSAAAPVESLADSFSKMWLADPIMKALWEGKLAWGDILCTPEEEERCRVIRAEREEREAAERAARDALLAEYPVKPPTARRVAFADAPPKPAGGAGAEVIVPPYTVGIKTVITRNLPRDVTVERLRSAFEKYGPIRDIYIPKNMDRSSPYFGTIKGFALVKFLKAEDSGRAYESEYGRLVFGKNNITVEFAKEDR